MAVKVKDDADLVRKTQKNTSSSGGVLYSTLLQPSKLDVVDSKRLQEAVVPGFSSYNPTVFDKVMTGVVAGGLIATAAVVTGGLIAGALAPAASTASVAAVEVTAAAAAPASAAAAAVAPVAVTAAAAAAPVAVGTSVLATIAPAAAVGTAVIQTANKVGVLTDLVDLVKSPIGQVGASLIKNTLTPPTKAATIQAAQTSGTQTQALNDLAEKSLSLAQQALFNSATKPTNTDSTSTKMNIPIWVWLIIGVPVAIIGFVLLIKLAFKK